jgi:hypothetical protein
MEQVRIVDRVIARRKGEATDAPGDLPFGGLTAKSVLIQILQRNLENKRYQIDTAT